MTHRKIGSFALLALAVLIISSCQLFDIFFPPEITISIQGPTMVYAGDSTIFQLITDPADAEVSSVEWNSSDSSIASILYSTSNNRIVETYKPGAVTITAESYDVTNVAEINLLVTAKAFTLGEWYTESLDNNKSRWYSTGVKPDSHYLIVFEDSYSDSSLLADARFKVLGADMDTVLYDGSYESSPNSISFTSGSNTICYLEIINWSSTAGSFKFQVYEDIQVDLVSFSQDSYTLVSSESYSSLVSVLPVNAFQDIKYSSSIDGIWGYIGNSIYANKLGTATLTASSAKDSAKTDTATITVVPKLLANGSWCYSEFPLDLDMGVYTGVNPEFWYDFPVEADTAYSIEWDVTENTDNAGIWISASNAAGNVSYLPSQSMSLGTSSRVITPTEAGTVHLRIRKIGDSNVIFAIRQSALVAVTDISLDKSSLTMLAGDNETIAATILPSAMPQSVTWTSDNTNIATVDTAGQVTAISPGTVSITAASTFDDTKTASCTVRVIESKKTSWTVMYYSDADCDLEAALMADIAEMKAGLQPGADINLILLVDRHPSSTTGYTSESTILGENFTDMRLYRILPDSYLRIDGSTQFPEITTSSTYEGNMGSANTLKKFIEFSKANYPADHYALFLSNHGAGARSASEQTISSAKSICFDETSDNDSLYTAEFTDILNDSHSVDLLAFDACLMATAEVAYQYRPGTGDFSANYLVASAPTVWGLGFPYTEIFERIGVAVGNNGTTDVSVGGTEIIHAASDMTAADFGSIIVEEQLDDTMANTTYGGSQSLGLFDLSAIAAVKTAVDELAVSLYAENKKADFETVRGSLNAVLTMHYFNEADENEWISYPYFDLYDLAARIAASPDFSTNIQTKADAVRAATGNATIYSFGNSNFSGFTNGNNGLSIFSPDGDRLVLLEGNNYPMWAFQWWYNSIDTYAWNPQPGFLYGKLSWCIDAQDAAVNSVGNWFELLDAWFDAANEENGAYNGYQW